MFKVGDIVSTRDGREVEVLKVDAPNNTYPVIGMYLHNGCVFNRTKEGEVFPFETNGGDLLPPKRTREVTVWVNVYATSEAVHITKSDAEGSAGNRALAVAVPHTFTLEW